MSSQRETRRYPPPVPQVLVVDDEADVRRLVRRVLFRSGLATIEASSVAAAIEILAARGDGIAAVLTDLHTLRGDAHDLVAWCRDHQPSIPILCMTGSFDVEGLNVPIVHKPFVSRELITALRAVIDLREPAPSA